MIVTEITIVLLLFSWGAASGVVVSLLNVFGRASRPARAVADAAIPLSVAAAYFFGLYLAASGEFRVYSLAAFAAGCLISLFLCVRFYPLFKRLARRLFSPLISLENRLEKRVEERLAPILAKRKERRLVREEKRKERRSVRAEEKKRREEEKERERRRKKRKKEEERRKTAEKRPIRRAEKRRKRFARDPSLLKAK